MEKNRRTSLWVGDHISWPVSKCSTLIAGFFFIDDKPSIYALTVQPPHEEDRNDLIVLNDLICAKIVDRNLEVHNSTLVGSNYADIRTSEVPFGQQCCILTKSFIGEAKIVGKHRVARLGGRLNSELIEIETKFDISKAAGAALVFEHQLFGMVVGVQRQAWPYRGYVVDLTKFRERLQISAPGRISETTHFRMQLDEWSK